ncbi:MAG: deiodinase [Verrucomicrobia bacterium]|nr:deiodinase [Verrucomicrobiota bacterium]
MVYIKEAHPSDGWAMPDRNERRGISVRDPKSYDERVKVADRACSALKIKLPCLVDGMDNAVNKAYAAWPDRIYVVDIHGKIAVAGGQGPRGFVPAMGETREWLEQHAR